MPPTAHALALKHSPLRSGRPSSYRPSATIASDRGLAAQLQALQPQLAALLESEPMMPDSDPFGPKTAVDGGQVEPSGIEPVTCLVCGCLCDDISVVKQGEKITAAGNACVLGREWLLRDRLHEPGKPAALVKGQPVEAAEAVELAARLLMNAKAPIILGLGRSTNETVAAAVELADRIGAVVEPGNKPLIRSSRACLSACRQGLGHPG